MIQKPNFSPRQRLKILKLSESIANNSDLILKAG